MNAVKERVPSHFDVPCDDSISILPSVTALESVSDTVYNDLTNSLPEYDNIIVEITGISFFTMKNYYTAYLNVRVPELEEMRETQLNIIDGVDGVEISHEPYSPHILIAKTKKDEGDNLSSNTKNELRDFFRNYNGKIPSSAVSSSMKA